MTRALRPAVLACVYCGRPAHGLACGSHRDLLRIDPYYVMSTSRGPYVRARKVNDGSALSR